MSDLFDDKNSSACETHYVDDPRLDMLREEDGKLRLTEKQAEAVLSEGKLLISASAGSGKTATLIKRILVLVAEGRASLRDMLVCVYNDSAQAELRQRLHSGLIEVAMSERDAQKRGRLLSAIDDLPFCRISTIHAYCSSLIRENFEKLGISPVFEIADDMTVNALMNGAMEEVFASLSASGDADFAALVDIFAVGRDEEGLKQHVKNLYDRLIMHEDREDFKRKLLGDFDSSPLHGELAELYRRRAREAIDVLDSVYADVTSFERLCSDKRMDVPLMQAAEFAKSIAEAEDFSRMCKSAADTPPFEKCKTSRGLEGAERDTFYLAKYCVDDMSAFKNSLAEVYANWDNFRTYHEQNVKFTSKLLEITLRTEEALERMKSEKNLLGYQDLLILAAKLLKENPELGGEFKIVFVDEYQDVDPLQEFIFARLIKDECFMVGDVKQSIYGFRLADPKILMSRKAAFEAGEGKVIEFNSNFRSNKDILGFVNDVFDAVMTEDSADVNYRRDGAFDLKNAKEVKPVCEYSTTSAPEGAHISCENAAGDGACAKGASENEEESKPENAEDKNEYSSVKLCLFGSQPSRSAKSLSGIYDITAPETEDEDDTLSVADRQAGYILDRINDIVGKQLNAEYDDGRTLDYGDIAILSRTTLSKNPTLQRVLEVLRAAGVPLDETNVGSAASEAERELILALKAIDNPRQDIPFAGYLLSYFGGYSEQELADISGMRGERFYDKFLETAKGDGALAAKARDTLAELDKYRLKASFKNVGKLMQSIITDYMYDAYMLGKGEGNLAELKNFVASAEEVSLGRFLEEYSAGDEKAVSACVNSVKVSTIHKFKGLECPVVFVLDLSRVIKESSSELIISNEGYVGMKYYDFSTRTSRETFSRFALKKLEKAKELKEEMRLMYVALTRAKQLMYVMASVPQSYEFGKKPYLMGEGLSNPREFLSLARFRRTLRHEPEDEGPLKNPPVYGHAPIMNFTAEKELLDKVTEARAPQNAYKHIEATKLSMKYSVSQLGASDGDTQNIFAEEDATAAMRGTAYHKVMQNINFELESLEQVEAALDEMLAAGKLTEEERAAVDARDIEKCLSSQIMRSAKEADARGECERERAFMMLVPANSVGRGESDDKVLVQGVIDLYIKGKQRVILDFKTGYVAENRVPKNYERQLYVYKMAAEAADKAKIDKILIYSFKSGETVELHPDPATIWKD